ncbi:MULTISPECIES: hypothetical protein [Actinomycetes]|uniref:hypothetical protein n=1 Tax=Actinomycetes TaxID=1760 RepID=UPI000CFB30A3|nr:MULTISPECIES: hypothetical protein [unclassified Arthrobacter]PQZ90378.1 hypothetical protein CQ016_00200 [Arthrobacter sp. MYb222]PRB76043.1 hypothetical protein CQ012_10305 [Arthrobacter sp. MYb214]TDU21791.1 hypothetical protein EDF61_111106 [Arthrobacter sp. JUb115]
MSLNNSEFDDVRKDSDTDEPLDGRDSQPAAGSSDAPQAQDAEDPLRGADRVLEENDGDPLALNPETLLPEPIDGQRPVDDTLLDYPDQDDEQGLDAERTANLPDQRETPDQQ